MRGSAVLAVWPLAQLVSGERPTLVAASAGLVFLRLLALGLRHGAKATGLFAVSLGLGLAIRLAEMATRKALPTRSQLFGRLIALVLTSAVCAGGFLFYPVAMETEDAPRVTTLRNTSVVFALLLAWGLGERPGRNGWIGAALVGPGAAGLGWKP
jgi:uncharacterized membrane protein